MRLQPLGHPSRRENSTIGEFAGPILARGDGDRQAGALIPDTLGIIFNLCKEVPAVL